MTKIYFTSIFILLFIMPAAVFSQTAAKNTSVVAMCGCPGEIWDFSTAYKPSVTFTIANNSKRLMHTDYGFNIPATATITGIKVSYNYTCGSTPANTLKDSLCMLYYNGGMIGADKSPETGFYASSGTIDFGGAADMWGTSLSPAEINSPLFGFNMKIFAGAANSYFAMVNGAAITIYYNLASGISESQKSSPGIKVFMAHKELKIENTIPEKTRLEIFNLTGKKIFETSFDGKSNSVDLSGFEKGVYIYRVESLTKSKVARLMLD